MTRATSYMNRALAKFAPCTFARFAPRRSAPLKFAPDSCASSKFAPVRSAKDRFASVRFAAISVAPDRFAEVRFAPNRLAKIRFAPDKSTLGRSAPWQVVILVGVGLSTIVQPLIVLSALAVGSGITDQAIASAIATNHTPNLHARTRAAAVIAAPCRLPTVVNQTNGTWTPLALAAKH